MSHEIRCFACDALLAQIDTGRHKPLHAYCPKCDPTVAILRKVADSGRRAPKCDTPGFMSALFGGGLGRRG